MVLADRMLRSARAVFLAGEVQKVLRARVQRPALRLAGVSRGERIGRAGAARAAGVRGAAELVRSLAGARARRVRQAGPVEGHDADRVDGSRVHAWRAERMGEIVDGLVRGDGTYAAVRVG